LTAAGLFRNHHVAIPAYLKDISMTNVSAPGKVAVRNFLRRTALQELEKLGYKVERIPRAGKGSLRRITKDGVSRTATIRTSQDAWFAFPRNSQDTGWSTLEDADVVVVASLTEKGGSHANVHVMDGNDIRERFDRARAARLKAHHVMPAERGIWLSLYNPEADEPVSMVGAGAGLAFKPIVENIPVVIDEPAPTNGADADSDAEDGEDATSEAQSPTDPEDAPLTIAEAKRRLALAFGVDPGAIKITIEG
jgi:hypothetical protein